MRQCDRCVDTVSVRTQQLVDRDGISRSRVMRIGTRALHRQSTARIDANRIESSGPR